MPRTFADYLASDLDAFDDWRAWSGTTLASYVATMLAQFRRTSGGR